MTRFFLGATSFKSWSSVRLESVFFALSKTSRHELIATCTDNSCEVTVISLSSNPAETPFNRVVKRPFGRRILTAAVPVPSFPTHLQRHVDRQCEYES